jgi:MFS family permease
MFRDRTFLGLNIAVFFMMIGVGMVVAILPEKIMEQTGSGETAGFLASAFAVSYILFQIPMGILADRIGVKPLLVGGYCVCCGAGILYYTAHTPGLIFMGRFIQGIGEVPVWALVPALLAVKFPGMRARAMGIYTAVFHMGLATGPVLGLVFRKALGEIGIFLVYAGLCLAGALVLQATVTAGKAKGQVEKFPMMKNIRTAFRIIFSKHLIPLTGISLHGMGYGAFITVIPVFLMHHRHFSPSAMGVFFTLFYLSVCVSQFCTGPLSDAFGRKKFMVAGLWMAAAGLAVFPSLDQGAAMTILGGASLGFGMFYLSSLAYLNEAVPDSEKGTVSGVYFLFWGMGYFGGPLIISLMEKEYGAGHGFYLFSAMVAGLAVLLTVDKIRRPVKY